MSPLDAVWLRLIDRELRVSAFSHDVRGPLTALEGFAELEGFPEGSPLHLASGRLTEHLGFLTQRAPRDGLEDLSECFGVPSCPVRTAAPLYALALTLSQLPHGAIELDDTGTDAVLLVNDVESAALTQDWNIAMVAAWLQNGGPELVAARVRISARVVGAVGVQLPLRSLARGVLSIAFARPAK